MITFQLGDFVFQEMEIPESIPFGGQHLLSTKKLIGGARVVDALGPDPKPLEWSGTFFPTPDGQSALARALTLKQIFDAGKPVYLSWDSLYYQVLIANYDPDYRFGRIPYRISCVIIADLTAPVYQDFAPDADDLINGDLDTADTLSSSVGDSTLTGLMTTLKTAAAKVGTFVNAAKSEVNSVLQPLHAVSNQVLSLIGKVDSTLASVGVPGGVLPGVPAIANIAALTSQLSANSVQISLLRLKAVTGRMALNLGQINSSVRTITVPGGNLFDIAAHQYGDATAWTVIAQANGLTDPQLVGITQLTIPPFNGNTGGVLNS
ncbi:LysM peptidoglycan-binding domain-containing protein [Paraburkholderia xenovorans]|uniref:LysM peptidoglycan-binding domain-containing protein n=1 Tax=Paraburkholderia xenovorans TaxID=36873 RepID=UPI0038BD0666